MTTATRPLSSTDHAGYMRLCVSLAQTAPLRSSNYRVGALLLDPETNTVLSTGYTMEVSGNTHAEQCALIKLARAHHVSEEDVDHVIPPGTVLYTTMEPCVKRLSGNMSCVDRILRSTPRDDDGKGRGGGIRKVYVGLNEPDVFVKRNDAWNRLVTAGVGYEIVPGFEQEIRTVAMAGHPT